MMPIDASAARLSLARHLGGEGIEIGASCKPFPVPIGATVRYVDRWTPDEATALYPELAGYEFVPPDVVVDVDTEGLGPIPSGSVDFVIASHLLEHVANPIGVLEELHRVLRPGGVAVIVLPDRTRTPDAKRRATPLADVTADYRRGATAVDDEHMIDFVRLATDEGLPPDADRSALFEWHRRRSISVHCWSDDEFWPVVGFGIEALGHRWEHVDGFATADPGADGIEFGFVLRKDTVPLPAPVRAHRWYAAVDAWKTAHQFDLAHELVAARQEVTALRASTSWRVTAPLRRASDMARDLRNRARRAG